MEWYWVLLLIIGGLMAVLGTAIPVAFGFMLVGVFCIAIFMGGATGLELYSHTLWEALARFVLLPVPMFVLLGEVLFRSGMAMRAIDVLNAWMGKLPGRLGLLAVLSGTFFSAMSGSTVSTTCVLGEVLIPEMEKRGYKKTLSIGAIIASGGLASIIPPSTTAVIWASVAEVSVGKMLIGGIIPGIIMAIVYIAIIVTRCKFDKSIAPAYDVNPMPVAQKINETFKYLLPLSFIILAVTGFIFLGVATPSESAALGALATIILAFAYKKLNSKLLHDSLFSTIRIVGMVFLIMAGSKAYGQVLAHTGAAREFSLWVTTLPISGIAIIIMIHCLLLILGCFMGAMPIIMITVPIFLPIIKALGFDPVWFGITYVMNMEIGHTTPPFGIQLFAMQGVAPKGTTMGEIIRASLPFTISDIFVMLSVIFFPVLALWLPNML